jgi:hypothetical protein
LYGIQLLHISCDYLALDAHLTMCRRPNPLPCSLSFTAMPNLRRKKN